MLASYDTLKTENEQITTEMEAQKAQIENLLEQVKSGNYSLAKAKKEAETLRRIMKGYVVTIDSLNQANQLLTAENLTVKQQLGETQGQRDALATEKQTLEGEIAKGSVLRVAQIAGIQAAKRTDELIPLCHTIPLDDVDVHLELSPGGVRIRAEASATWTTGVEMEAFAAVMAAALTVIDMGKAVDRLMVIEGVRLLEKTGGRSGTYRAHDVPGAAHQPREGSR